MRLLIEFQANILQQIVFRGDTICEISQSEERQPECHRVVIHLRAALLIAAASLRTRCADIYSFDQICKDCTEINVAESQ